MKKSILGAFSPTAWQHREALGPRIVACMDAEGYLGIGEVGPSVTGDLVPINFVQLSPKEATALAHFIDQCSP